MAEVWVLIHVAVFGAALFQTATGIGFGLIAAPILMIALDDVAAVQITIVLSLLIALILSPSLWRRSDRPMLRNLVVGTIVGLPVGILIYLRADLSVLEVLAGVVVLTMGCGVLRSTPPSDAGDQKPRRAIADVFVGSVCGVMTACLAMPGPLPAVWMASRSFGKDAIRATMLTLFVPAYALALVLQISVASVSTDTMTTTVQLVPATLLGLLCGRALALRISEGVFRLSLSILLLATAVSLLISGIGSLVTGAGT